MLKESVVKRDSVHTHVSFGVVLLFLIYIYYFICHSTKHEIILITFHSSIVKGGISTLGL